MPTLIVENNSSKSLQKRRRPDLPPPVAFGPEEFAARFQSPELSKEIIGSTFMAAARGGVFVTGTLVKGESRQGELVFTFETPDRKSAEIRRSDFQYASLLKGNTSVLAGQSLSDFTSAEPRIRRTDISRITERAPQAGVSREEMANRVRLLVEEAARADPASNAAWLSEASRRFIGYRLDVSAYAPEIGAVNIYRATLRSVSFGAGGGMQQPVMVMLPARGLAAVFSPVRALNPDYRAALDAVEMGLSGNEIEVDYALVPAEKLPLEHWDGRDNFEMKIYGTQIHPAAISKVKECLSAIDSPSVRVVDIFGGNGTFARRLVDCIVPSKKAEVHVIDGNEHCVEEAKKRCSGCVRVHHADLSRVRISDLIEGPLDVVTAVGALTRGVVDRVHALQIASGVFQDLTRGGMFVLTGFTALRLNARDFSDIGFEVLNKSVPANLLGLSPAGSQPEQLYVLRKPLHP